VADVFDALITDRVYREAYTYDEAVTIMRAEGNSHFDPQVLDAFLGAEAEIKTIVKIAGSS
jgi:putative two-component system response regulator